MAVALGATALGASLQGPRAGLWLLAPAALLGATGVGLLKGLRLARVLAKALMVVALVGIPLALVRDLVGGSARASDPGDALRLANAVATTALATWLCFVSLQSLREKQTNIVITTYIVCAALATISVHHLWELARLVAASPLTGFSLVWRSDGFAIRVSSSGMALIGFFGWPLWHLLVLMATGRGLLQPRAELHELGAMFALLFAAMGALGVATMVSLGTFVMLPPVLAMALIATALAWWLRAELREGQPRSTGLWQLLP